MVWNVIIAIFLGFLIFAKKSKYATQVFTSAVTNHHRCVFPEKMMDTIQMRSEITNYSS